MWTGRIKMGSNRCRRVWIWSFVSTFGRKRRGKEMSESIILFLQSASLLSQYITTSPDVIAKAFDSAKSIV